MHVLIGFLLLWAAVIALRLTREEALIFTKEMSAHQALRTMTYFVATCCLFFTSSCKFFNL